MDNTLDTTDAEVWASEFCNLYNTKPNFTIDKALMIAWFANAIEKGRQVGRKEGWKEGSRLDYAPNKPDIINGDTPVTWSFNGSGTITSVNVNKQWSPGVSIKEND